MLSILINKVSAAAIGSGIGAGSGIGSGAGSGTGSGGIDNPIRFDSLTDLLVFIGGQLYLLSIPIVAIMILYGAFQILTAAGEPDKIQTGKRTIFYAIIGFAVVLIAGGITDLIKSFTSK